MSQSKYKNFVRPSLSEVKVYPVHPNLSGNEARKLYLEEVKEVGDPEPVYYEDYHNPAIRETKHVVCKTNSQQLTDKDLFLSAQSNDVVTLRHILDVSPNKINIVDDYGWSLLMIACQANSIDSVEELLNRDIDINIRDKAGNSARSLVIKNKNLVLADLLISHKNNKPQEPEQYECKRVKLKEEFMCQTCNKTYPDKQEHLSSTIHNINASKGKKIPVNYVIPTSNKGYQLMIKGGWDRELGLGPDGSGKRYPIKTKQKKDRKGLGHEKKVADKKEESSIHNKETIQRNCRYNKKMEIKFRREFY